MFKNVASQKITLLAINTTTNAPQTGDAANLTFYVTKDDGSVTALTDTSAAELDATNAPGMYSCDVSQSECNADKLMFTGKSSTANVKVVPSIIYTRANNINDMVITSSGIPEVNATQLAGSATPITNMNTVFNTDFAVNYNTTNDGWVVKLGNYVHGGSSAEMRLDVLEALTEITTNQITSSVNSIPWNTAWDAEVQSEAQDAITASSLPTAVQVWAAATRTLTALDEDTTTLDLDATITAAVPTAAQIATAVLTTAMTEAYRTAGGTATLAQAVYELISHMGDSVISGTTKTLRKIDGTTAKTYTLDSASTPTSITEAT